MLIKYTGKYVKIYFIMKITYWHTQPVHLTSPHSNSPDTHIKHFSPSTSGNTLLPVTYVWHLHAGSTGTTPLHLQFSISRRPVRSPLQTVSSAHITLCLDHRLRSFWISSSSPIICIGFADSPTLVALRLRFTLDIIIMHGCVDPHAFVSFVL